MAMDVPSVGPLRVGHPVCRPLGPVTHARDGLVFGTTQPAEYGLSNDQNLWMGVGEAA